MKYIIAVSLCLLCSCATNDSISYTKKINVPSKITLFALEAHIEGNVVHEEITIDLSPLAGDGRSNKNRAERP